MMVRDETYYFKMSKVNGVLYLQVWKKNKMGKHEFLVSGGNAKKVYEKLVRCKELEGQTKILKEIETKLSMGWVFE
jgi:hypothetical protein